MSNLVYFIIPIGSITQEMIDHSDITSALTMKLCTDKSNGLLKFQTKNVPISCLGLTPLSHEEMLVEIAKEEWN